MKKNRVNIVVVCTLYIFLVLLTPLIFESVKGSVLNTVIKFLILLFFGLAIVVRSKFNFVTSFGKMFLFVAFVFSQLFCYILYGSLNLMSSAAQAVLLFIILFPLNNIFEDDDKILWGIKFFLIFDLTAILYNIIVNFNYIIDLSFITDVRYDMYSFFDNKNTYGMILFVAFPLLFYYRSIKPNCNKIRFNIMLFIQLIAIAMSLCRTALLCSGIFLILVYLRSFSIKKLIKILLLVLVCMVLLQVQSVRDFILYHILRIDVGTFREDIQTGALKLIGERLLCGYGEDNFSLNMFNLTGNLYAHNGFYSILLSGGLLYFLGYMAFFIVIIRNCLRIKKANSEFAYQVFIFVICTIVYAFFESVIMCGSSASNFAFCLVAYIIPSVYYGRERRTTQ